MAKKKYQAHPFESAGGYRSRNSDKLKDDVSANLYESMLRSQAYMDLTDKQKVLYSYCKLQFFGKRKPQRDFPEVEQFKGEDRFYMNVSLAIEEYGLYPKGSSSNFYRDMAALIEHGFIDRVSSGQSHRQKTVYAYSDRWKKWNPEAASASPEGKA